MFFILEYQSDKHVHVVPQFSFKCLIVFVPAKPVNTEVCILPTPSSFNFLRMYHFCVHAIGDVCYRYMLTIVWSAALCEQDQNSHLEM